MADLSDHGLLKSCGDTAVGLFPVAVRLTAPSSLVLTQEPGLDLHELADYFPQAGGLDQAIRGVIGMDAEAVHERFTAFVHAHPTLASHQIKFLDLLQNHIAKFASIEIEQLYEPPFTTLHNDGPDGLFEQSLADELFEIIGSFQKGSEHPLFYR